jgi:alcohol dehydrogenase (cytochrome c)/quinohemoprotein ethanol dehydrogenase
MSYDPQTGYVFVPTQNTTYTFSNPAEFVPQNTGWNIGQDAMPGEPANPQAAQILENEPLSALIAWNPLTQTEAWRVSYSV